VQNNSGTKKNQSYFESTDPEALKNNFTDKIGSTVTVSS
jgi:hypothetical protein